MIGEQGQKQVINAVIDTGFNGFLTLPSKIISSLVLPWNAFETVTLGDGSETLFDLYVANIVWNGKFRDIYVAQSETEPLVGTALLHGYSLHIDFTSGGVVRLKPLES